MNKKVLSLTLFSLILTGIVVGIAAHPWWGPRWRRRGYWRPGWGFGFRWGWGPRWYRRVPYGPRWHRWWW